MKRKMLMRMLGAALSAFLLAGCGNTAKPADSGSVVTAGEEDGTDAAEEADVEEEPGSEESEEADVEEPGAGNEPEEADAGQKSEESEVPEDETELEPVNWLEEHGIAITPQGDWPVNLYGYDSYVEDYVCDFEAGVNVAISETIEGADEGLKKVTAVYTVDMSNMPEEVTGCRWNTSSFDRYTGTYFRGNAKTKDAVRIGDEYYDIRTEYEQENNWPLSIVTYTVTCPADYDGTVFQFGYTSPEKGEEYDKNDYTARLYTMDELPYYGEGYLRFTLTDE